MCGTGPNANNNNMGCMDTDINVIQDNINQTLSDSFGQLGGQMGLGGCTALDTERRKRRRHPATVQTPGVPPVGDVVLEPLVSGATPRDGFSSVVGETTSGWNSFGTEASETGQQRWKNWNSRQHLQSSSTSRTHETSGWLSSAKLKCL